MNQHFRKLVRLTNHSDSPVSIDKETLKLDAYEGKRFVSLIKDEHTEFIGECIDDSQFYDRLRAGLTEQQLLDVVGIMLLQVPPPPLPSDA